jgi:hypothetical protein
MKDLAAHHAKLLTDSAQCELISKQATDPAKRDFFARLSEHLKILADEIERAISRSRPRP